MFPGVEIAVGYVFAWAVRKTRLVAGRADGEVDRALEAGMDRVHEVVSRKLGQDPALEQAAEEASEGHAQLSDETRQWLALSLNNAARRDEEFAAALKAAVEEVQAAERAASGGGVSASGYGVAVGKDVNISAPHGVAGWHIDTINVGNPPQPGTPQS